MNSVITLLSNDEINQVTGGEKNETVSDINTAVDFQLVDHPWLITGIVVVCVCVIVPLNVYFYYKLAAEGCPRYSPGSGYGDDLSSNGYGFRRRF